MKWYKAPMPDNSPYLFVKNDGSVWFDREGPEVRMGVCFEDEDSLEGGFYWFEIGQNEKPPYVFHHWLTEQEVIDKGFELMSKLEILVVLGPEAVKEDWKAKQ